jgi:pyruvate dehydrogenase E1 component alpha subunit
MTSAATANHASNGGAARMPERATGVVRLLSPDGRLLAGPAPLDDERAVALHEAVERGRLAARAASRLADEGRIGMCPRGEGRQAAYTGAALALRANDWLFAEGREHGAALLRGLSWRGWAAQLFGNADDLTKGRQTPGGWSSRVARLASVSAPLGTHLIHAVGLAWGAKIRGDDVVSLATFEQGAVASSDFHNALNFAGVFSVATVFLCVGDGRAIENADLDFGAAYGVTHRRCDGDDPFAVFHATAEAVDRAAAGGGATLLEALIPPSDGTALVPSRLARFLEAQGRWNDARQQALEKTIESAIDDAVASASRAPAPSRASLIDDVFAEAPWHLHEQRRELER